MQSLRKKRTARAIPNRPIPRLSCFASCSQGGTARAIPNRRGKLTLMALSCYASHDLKEIASRSLLFQTSPSHRDTILMRGRPMLQWFPRSTRSHVLKTRLMHIQCTRARSRCLRAQRAQLTRSASGATCGAGATPGAAASGDWMVEIR